MGITTGAEDCELNGIATQDPDKVIRFLASILLRVVMHIENQEDHEREQQELEE